MRKAIDRERLARADSETQGIRCADLISNTSTIVHHADLNFATMHLVEKRAMLEVLTAAPATLREMAWRSLQAAEIELVARRDRFDHGLARR